MNLREELETLREENRQLRALVTSAPVEYDHLGFSRSQRIIFTALMNANTTLTRGQLMDHMAFARNKSVDVLPKSIDVMICRIRNNLAGLGFLGVIRSEWDVGYYIRSDDKARLKATLAARRIA